MRARPRGLTLSMILAASCSKDPAPPAPEEPPPSPSTATVASEPKDPKPEPKPLSQEDLDLIAADPATLTPDQRRKRAYALRRKIMQDPDSPAARMLEDLRKAHEAGELELPPPKGGTGPTLSLPGTTPPGGGRPPAGHRPDAASSGPGDETP